MSDYYNKEGSLEPEHEASDPITRAREFCRKGKSIFAQHDFVCSLMAQFAESENAQLLAETLRLRQEVERLGRERFEADLRLSQFEGFVHARACPHGGKCLCESFAALGQQVEA